MEDGTCTIIPAHVVPHKSEASNTIKINILEIEIAKESAAISNIGFGSLVAQSQRERGIKEPVASKHPVVSIAARNGIIEEFCLIEHEGRINLCGSYFGAQFVFGKTLEFVPIDVDGMLGVAYANERTAC